MYLGLQIIRSDPSSAHGYAPGEIMLGRPLVYPCEIDKDDVDFEGNFLFFVFRKLERPPKKYFEKSEIICFSHFLFLRNQFDCPLGGKLDGNSRSEFWACFRKNQKVPEKVQEKIRQKAQSETIQLENW